MKEIYVQNMKSPRSGRSVANQFIIYTPEGSIFQSYNTTIAVVNAKGITLDPAWECSPTTAKYTRLFLGRKTTNEVRAGIKEGLYKIGELN